MSIRLVNRPQFDFPGDMPWYLQKKPANRYIVITDKDGTVKHEFSLKRSLGCLGLAVIAIAIPIVNALK